MLSVQDLSSLDGATLGGVSISIESNQLTLNGLIESFSIGGKQIAVDHLCPMPCEMDCIDFEEETLGAQYFAGDRLTEDNITMQISDGRAEIRGDGKAGFSGQDIALTGASLQLDFACAEEISLHYGQYGGKGQVVINGAVTPFNEVQDLDGLTTKGVLLEVSYDLVNGGTRGVLTATGLLESFSIGGDSIFLDHICLTPCPDPDCVDFELFPFRAVYEVGTELQEEMTKLTVTSFGNDGLLVIGGDNAAGYLGQEAVLQNAGLDFRYPCASEVTFRYAKLGGLSEQVSLTINGMSVTNTSFSNLDGTTLAGVTIAVTSAQVTLQGEIQQLIIAGENLAIDHVCQTQCVADSSCVDFEQVPANGSWGFFDGPVEDGVLFQTDFLFDSNTNVLNTSPTISIDNGQRAGFSGQDLEFNSAAATIEFGLPCVTNVSLRYGEYSGVVNLQVNGEFIVRDDLFDFNNTMIGGRMVYVTRIPVSGGVVGKLRIDGPVTRFLIGGENFFIDHLCFDECEPIVLGPLEILSANPVNGTERQAVMRFELTGPATLRLQESRDLGTANFWSTINDATFTPVPGQPNFFETTATHPLGDPRHFYRVRATYD